MPVLFIDEIVTCTDSLMIKKCAGSNMQGHHSNTQMENEFLKGNRAEFTTHDERILQKNEANVSVMAGVEDAIIYFNDATLFVDEYTSEIDNESITIDCRLEVGDVTMFEREGTDG
jgi:hypothetical protein